MKGIEILSSSEVAIGFEFNLQAAVIVFFAILILFLVIGFYFDKNYVVKVFLPIGLLLGMLFGTVVGDDFRIPTEYTMEHKVLISEEASLQDFLEKYELVDQEGKIYTVRERNTP